jgi:hypothetical protein
MDLNEVDHVMTKEKLPQTTWWSSVARSEAIERMKKRQTEEGDGKNFKNL